MKDEIDEIFNSPDSIKLMEYDISQSLKQQGVIPGNYPVLSDRAKQQLLALKKKWETEQDRYSRADEFLWFTRKLREYMDTSTSPKYKVFESNFIKQYEQKYINQLNGDK